MVKSFKLALAICALIAPAAIRANAQANTAPQLNPQQDQTIAELATLVITNTASDADVPAQTLSYALLDAPAGASASASRAEWNRG